MTTPDFRRPRPRRGQSLIELTLLFATLLIIFSGLVEFGFWMLEYSNLVVAARNAGRAALGFDNYQDIQPACHPAGSSTPLTECQPTIDYSATRRNEIVRCEGTCDATCAKDFYCATALIALETSIENNAPMVQFDPATDDIVLSIFTFVENDTAVFYDRHPKPHGYWSLFGNYASALSDEDVRNRILSQGVAHTSTGFILVEIFYNYHHKLGLPWITAFVPNPLLLHAYTFMPLYSASPTPTP